MSGSDWGFMVLWIVLAVALVVAVVWAIANVTHRDSGGAAALARSGRNILDERLARGEVEPDEYDRLRERLEHPTPPQTPTPA